MKRNLVKLLAISLAGMMTFSLCACKNEEKKSVEGVEFWGAYSSEKVLQDVVDIYDDIKKDPSVSVTAIRGEEEAYQIIMTATKEDVPSYDVVLNDLKSSSGDTFSKENIKVYHELYIHVNLGTEYYTESGYYPDGLAPFEGVKAVGENSFKANNNQGLYISFDVPQDQPSGTYSGTMEILIGEGVKEIPVELNVSPVTITEETHVQSSFLNEWYFYRGELDTTEEMFDLYNKFMFDYRCGCNNVTVYSEDVEYYAEKVCEYAALPECPGYNIPWFTRNYEDSGYILNGRELNVKHSYDVDKLILYLETIAYEGLEKGVDPFKKAFIYGWDEPDLGFGVARATTYIKEWSYIVRQCKNIVIDKLKNDSKIQGNEQLPKILESLDNIPHLVLSSKYLSSNIDLELEDTTYGPYFSHLETDGARNMYRHGEEDYPLWWYGCVAPDYPYPTYHIDDNVLSARIESWMKADYNIQGNLYWSTCLYSEPAQGGSIVYPENFYTGEAARTLNTNGEGFLVYPGKKYGVDGPISSLRMEQIRDGLEEYEMLYYLSETYKSVSKSIGEEFSEDAFMRYIYDRLYSGTKVGTTAKNFEDTRALLLDVCELAESDATVCLMNVAVGSGSYSFEVFVKDGYELKQAGTTVSNKRAVNGGNVYTVSIVPANGDVLDISVDAGGTVYGLNLSFGSSSTSYNAKEFDENEYITERYVKVKTKLVDAKTVNPDAADGEKYLQIKLDDAEKDVYQDFLITGSVVTSMSEKDNKCVIRIYNVSENEVNVKLALKYESKDEYKTWSNYTLKSGMNEIALNNMEGLRWKSIKSIKQFRLIVGKEGDKARDYLYFVDMSVYQK